MFTVITLSVWFTSVLKQIGNCLDKTVSQSSVYSQVYAQSYTSSATCIANQSGILSLFLPIHSFYSGIKFIPLRTPGGELILESGLFVQIKKTSVQNDSTLGLQEIQPLIVSSTSEQPGNVKDPSNDNNQLTCDAEVYDNQYTNIDDH